MKHSLTSGSIWRGMLFFALPILLGNIFQQLYNTADAFIVGRFLDKNAYAAVSSSGSLIFLLVGFFNGIAVGAGVVIARYYGAKDNEKLQTAVHTTLAFGLTAGIVLTVLGMTLTPQLLRLMKTDADVLPNSIDYFRMYFAGSMRRHPAGRGRQPPPAVLPDPVVACEHRARPAVCRCVPLGGLVCRTGHEYFAVREPRPLHLPPVPL